MLPGGDEDTKLRNRQRLEVPPGPSPLERRLNFHAPANKLPSQKPNIGHVPPSSVLDRLKQFMPRMHEANQVLEEQLQGVNPQAYDIEEVDEGQEGGYIEMDLTCGLLDLKDADAVRAAEQALLNGQSAQECGGAEESASSENESTSEGDDASSDDSDVQDGLPYCTSTGAAAVDRDTLPRAALQEAQQSGNTTDQLQQQQRRQRKLKARRRGSAAPKISEL